MWYWLKLCLRVAMWFCIPISCRKVRKMGIAEKKKKKKLHWVLWMWNNTVVLFLTTHYTEETLLSYKNRIAWSNFSQSLVHEPYSKILPMKTIYNFTSVSNFSLRKSVSMCLLGWKHYLKTELSDICLLLKYLSLTPKKKPDWTSQSIVMHLKWNHAQENYFL